MGKTRSLARAQVGPIQPSHHVKYFGNDFQRENEKMNLGNKKHLNGCESENIGGKRGGKYVGEFTLAYRLSQ